MAHTEEDRLCVVRWRGLRDHVLDELTELDRRALAAGRCRFLGVRARNTEDRERCKQLRDQHGLDHMGRLPRTYSEGQP